jgi:hypothetical protein
MTKDEIKHYYDSHPLVTLRELSALTGRTVAALKRLLLS